MKTLLIPSRTPTLLSAIILIAFPHSTPRAYAESHAAPPPLRLEASCRFAHPETPGNLSTLGTFEKPADSMGRLDPLMYPRSVTAQVIYDTWGCAWISRMRIQTNPAASEATSEKFIPITLTRWRKEILFRSVQDEPEESERVTLQLPIPGTENTNRSHVQAVLTLGNRAYWGHCAVRLQIQTTEFAAPGCEPTPTQPVTPPEVEHDVDLRALPPTNQ